MKLTVKLTRAQREEISSLLEDITALWKKRLANMTGIAEKLKHLGELQKTAIRLEKAANAGDMDASRELLAVKDQIGRLKAAFTAAPDADEGEIGGQATEENELITEANSLSALALQTRKGIAWTSKDAHLDQLTEILAPFFELRHHAKNHAGECHSYGSLLHFCGSRCITARHVEEESAFSQLTHHQGTLIELLKTGIVWEFKGSEKLAEGSTREKEEAPEEAESLAS